MEINNNRTGIICPNCRAKNKPGAKFCLNCGSKLPQQEEQNRQTAELICIRCGAANQPGMKYCTECGSRLETSGNPDGRRDDGVPDPDLRDMVLPDAVTCPVCGKPNELWMKFCVHCGAAMEAAQDTQIPEGTCPKCGMQNEPGMKFCIHCGARLDEAPNESDDEYDDDYDDDGKGGGLFRRFLPGILIAVLIIIIVIIVLVFAGNHKGGSSSEASADDYDTSAEADAGTAGEDVDTSETDTDVSSSSDTSAADESMDTTQEEAEEDEQADTDTQTDTDASDESSADTVTEEDEETEEASVSDSDYILPESNTRKYSRSELETLSDEELRLARNEIYARYGRMFNDESLQDYFDSKDWYEGIYSAEEFDAMFSDADLNAYEIYNRDLIVEIENERS